MNTALSTAHSITFHIENPYAMSSKNTITDVASFPGYSQILSHSCGEEPTYRPTIVHVPHSFCMQDRPYLPCSVATTSNSHPQYNSLSMHINMHYTPSTTWHIWKWHKMQGWCESIAVSFPSCLVGLEYILVSVQKCPLHICMAQFSLQDSPGHIRGPNPKGRKANEGRFLLFSLLHLSGMKDSGSGKIWGSLPITVRGMNVDVWNRIMCME